MAPRQDWQYFEGLACDRSVSSRAPRSRLQSAIIVGYNSPSVGVSPATWQMSIEGKHSAEAATAAGFVAAPIRSGLFQEIDQLAEMTTAMADLLTDLLETGARDSWSTREQEVAVAEA